MLMLDNSKGTEDYTASANVVMVMHKKINIFGTKMQQITFCTLMLFV
jgi:hypothetical protein